MYLSLSHEVKSLFVNVKVKQITSHFFWLWASGISHFSNFGKVVCYCNFANFGQILILIFTNFGQVIYFLKGENKSSSFLLFAMYHLN